MYIIRNVTIQYIGAEGLTGYELTVSVIPPADYPDACGDPSTVRYQISEVKTCSQVHFV